MRIITYILLLPKNNCLPSHVYIPSVYGNDNKERSLREKDYLIGEGRGTHNYLNCKSKKWT